MSYGWLTQSALLPKKSKEIKVDDEGSMFSLKAVMMKQKQKLKEGTSKPMLRAPKNKTSKNPGIEQRIKKDESISYALENKIKDSSRSMQIKQKVYGSLEAGKQNVGRLLVDFAGKGLEKDEDEQYIKDREQFYAGKLEQLKKNRDEAPVQDLGQNNFRERIAWQKQVLGMLSGSVEEKEKVKQVFDRKMHADEKQALTKVIEELNKEEKMKEQARKRREDLKQQRIMKLKKLNILPEEPKQSQPEILLEKNSEQPKENPKTNE